MKSITGSRGKSTATLHVARKCPLDSSQINAPLQVSASHKLRRERWIRRAKSAKFLAPLGTEIHGHLNPVRPARCSWTIGQSVGIMHDENKPAGYAGLERCSSIWACPSCSAVIRTGRAREIETAVARHQDAGGSVAFFTGTQRHHRGDELSLTLDVALTAWGRLLRNKAWRNMKKEFAISGYIRATEVTLNFDDGGHGWHPHIHALIFFDRELNPAELAQFRAKMFKEWTRSVAAVGGKEPTEKGLDLQKVDKDGKVLAQYIGKLQDDKDRKKWSAGAEAARFDAKNGRGVGALMPFELLDDDCRLPESQRGHLWREYYTATKGRRAITWARGLKARYDVEEKDDEEILLEEDATSLVWKTPARAYRRLRRKGGELPAVALEFAEQKNWKDLAKLLPPEPAWGSKKRKKLPT